MELRNLKNISRIQAFSALTWFSTNTAVRYNDYTFNIFHLFLLGYIGHFWYTPDCQFQ